MTKHLAITIGRQFGSGGREIGIRLGELLGIKVYDKELLTLAAEKKGLHLDYLRHVDEKAANSLLYTLAISATSRGAHHLGIDMSLNDQLFIAQTEIIKELAEKTPAIFIGRCADYVLRNHPNRISFFIHSDLESRVHRVMERHELSRVQAEALISKTDKKRVNYYNFYTGKKWGKFENYHMSLDSSLLGVEGTAQMMMRLIEIYDFEGKEE
jgi:cytidylate kinase